MNRTGANIVWKITAGKLWKVGITLALIKNQYRENSGMLSFNVAILHRKSNAKK